MADRTRRKHSSGPATTNTTGQDQTDVREADNWQYKRLSYWGIDAEFITKGEAFGAMKRLEQGHSPADVISWYCLKRAKVVGPSSGQVWKLESEGIDPSRASTKREAGLLLDAALTPLKFYKEQLRLIDKAEVPSDLAAVGRALRLVFGVLPKQHMDALIDAGKERQELIGKDDEIPE